MSTQNPKFKSAANEQVQGVRGTAEWKQPLKRHINPETSQLEFVTILVRVLSGDAEHDFHARFPPTTLTAAAVCEGIAAKERLTESEASLFRLWVISKDLELQLRPDQDIFELMVFWNRWVMKYTHFPEAENAQHPVNRHWFVYRREASITIAQERKLAGDEAISLLFGEAKRNLLTRRYCCTQMDGATIAAYQLQISLGNYSEERCPLGYLVEEDRLAQLLPLGMLDKMRPTQWEEIITVNYKSLAKLSVAQSRKGFLEFARKMPCYGCSFFPACTELPPSGFFEFRTQNWFIGIGPNGVCVVDADIPKYVYTYTWANIATCRTGHDQFFITIIKNGKSKEQAFISPQAKIISNLFTQCQYKYFKESGKLKKSGEELEKVVVVKSSEGISPNETSNLIPAPVDRKVYPLKSAVNNLKKSESYGKSLSSKMKGSVEKLNEVVESSSTNLNRSLNQLGRTVTKKLNIKEEVIPVNTVKVKVSSEVLNDMIPSNVLPKGYGRATPPASDDSKKPITKGAISAADVPIPKPNQTSIAEVSVPAPVEQPKAQATQNLSANPANVQKTEILNANLESTSKPPVDRSQNSNPTPAPIEKIAPKSRMQSLPPPPPLALKSPRKTKIVSDAEKNILAALSESPNTSTGALPVESSKLRQSMMPAASESAKVRESTLPSASESGKVRDSMMPGGSLRKPVPSQDEANILAELEKVAPDLGAITSSPYAARKSMQPLRKTENNGEATVREGVPKSRFGKVGQPVIVPAAEPKTKETHVDIPSSSEPPQQMPEAPINRNESVKIAEEVYESPVSIQITNTSDDEENRISPLPTVVSNKKRGSIFGTVIQPEAQRAASKRRQSSIGVQSGSINRRANDTFGFDQGLGGVGPTELLDLRNGPIDRKKTADKSNE